VPGFGVAVTAAQPGADLIRDQVTAVSSRAPACSSSRREGLSAARQSSEDQIRSVPDFTRTSRFASPASILQLALEVLVIVTVKTGWAPAA
jgi:hypothetical protein